MHNVAVSNKVIGIKIETYNNSNNKMGKKKMGTKIKYSNFTVEYNDN